MDSKIPAPQMSAWLLVATIGPLLSISGKSGWLAVLLAAAVCCVLSICVLTYGRGKMPRWLCVLELLWLVFFLGGLARESGTCWAEVNAMPVIPIVLLSLAAFVVRRGANQAARVGATLVWLVIPVLGIVFLAGTADADLQWVRRGLETPDGLLIGLLLIPCLGVFLPQDRTKKTRWVPVVLSIVAVAASVLMDAVMGETAAKWAANGFNEFSKGVTLFGVAERFEAFVACALTGGWFALFAIILSTAYHLAEQIFPQTAKWSVWICAAASIFLMCILHIASEWLVFGGLIFWVFLPVLTQGIVHVKNIEKK